MGNNRCEPVSSFALLLSCFVQRKTEGAEVDVESFFACNEDKFVEGGSVGGERSRFGWTGLGSEG